MTERSLRSPFVENDREHRALRDELRLARRDIATLQYQYQILVRDHKNLLGILERFGGLSSLSEETTYRRYGRRRPT